MSPVIGAVTAAAIDAADEECGRTRHWYRLTCSDIEVFTRRRERAVRAGEIADARAYERQVSAANEARRASWADYRRSVATLKRLFAGLSI